jgi:hypothetical protein
MNNRLNAKPVGQFLISIGMISILGLIFLNIFFVGYFNDIPSILFFGPLNDIFGSLEAILTAILAILVLALQGKRWLWLNSIGVVLTWIGTFIVTLDSLMAGGIVSTASASILRIKYSFPPLLTAHDLHFGFGLIGIWLLILNVQAMQNRSWPMYLIGLGFLTSIIMIFGLAGNSPLGFVILDPIWCILTGRNILRSVNTVK